MSLKTSKPKVFLVDDASSFSELTSHLIQLNGSMEVCGSATSAQEAIDQFNRSQPDILLTDLSMASMDGIEFIRTVKESHPKVRCVVLSGNDQRDYRHKAIDAGACGYILKGNAEEIIKGLDYVARGEVYISPGIR